MAVDVYTLLTLPSSPAFSKFRASEPGAAAYRPSAVSGSPPRKTPRLVADKDSASASRSRFGADKDAKGPVVVQLQGPPVRWPADSVYETDYRLTQRAIRVLLTRPPQGTPTESLPVTYERIYSACRAVVCAARSGENLYDFLKQEMERCTNTLARALLADSSKEVEWINRFNEVCKWFQQQVGLTQSLFAYLDRVYIPEHKDLQNIRALAYTHFRRRIIDDASIHDRLSAGIQAWIEWERKNKTAHGLQSSIPDLIAHLEHHSVYRETFEGFFLDVAREFYAAESQQIHQEYGARNFLLYCEERHVEEKKRAQNLLPRRTIDILMHTVDRALLSERLEWLAEGELPRQMEERQEEQLKGMYAMFSRVSGLKVLLASFKRYIQDKVSSIVKDTELEDAMVETLLDFKGFCDKLVAQAFVETVTDTSALALASRGAASSSAVPLDAAPVAPTKRVPNQDFVYGLTDAFQSGFRTRRNKPAELIAKHLDRAMRKGQKGKDDAVFQAELNRVLVLYRFTDDKDVFRTFYHRALAKRLLLQKSASDDFEKAVLKKLKEEYDPEFGMGDHMFKDLDLSRGLMQEYGEHRARLGDDVRKNKLNVMVLQRSFWPFTARMTDADLPVRMKEELARYTTFYKSKHQGHKLDWDHALGTAILHARFNAAAKELSVSLYQAIILLLFNEADAMTFEDVKAQTRIDDADLRRTLQSLACGKKRVLRKVPVGKDVKDGDVFHFNADFTDSAVKVHINSIQVKETPEESRRTQTLIEGDRKFALDAAIVRIMKGKKEMHYEQLKTATIDTVRKHFLPDVASIKQRIDSLVEQEYLTRKEDDMNVLVYVA